MFSLTSPLRGAHKLIFIVSVGLCLQAKAQEGHHDQDPSHDPIHHVHGSHPECPLPKTPMDTLRCAQEEHPDVKRAKLAAEQSKALIEAASQIPNPEIETQSVFGRVLGDQQMQSQISLTQPISLGGKRSARKDEAKAQESQAQADLKKVQADVTIETVTKLHRLRQLEREKAILDETVSSYAKLLSQYRSRPRLTPEQEVSQVVFEMALADSKIKRSLVADEEREIEHFFHVATGHGLSELAKALPMAPAKWPNVEEASEKRNPSPGVSRLMADQDFAAAELESARAASWPELRIGPMVQLQADGPVRGQLYGVQLNLELPFFNVNGGGRAYASKGLWKAEKSTELLKVEESHERQERVRVYRSAIDALKGSGSVAEIERKHHRVEALTMRGLVSSSLAIEAHRQRADLEKSRNERELKAIEALWTIYKFDGRIFGEVL